MVIEGMGRDVRFFSRLAIAFSVVATTGACASLVGLEDLPAPTDAGEKVNGLVNDAARGNFALDAQNEANPKSSGIDGPVGNADASISGAGGAGSGDARVDVATSTGGAQDASVATTAGNSGSGGAGGQLMNGGGGQGGVAGGGGRSGAAGTGGQSEAGGGGSSGCGKGCATTQVCVNDVCRCSAGLTQCGDDCADLATDKAHCGTCAQTCSGACSAGRCVNILFKPSQSTYSDLTVDKTSVYWITPSEDEGAQVPKGGGVSTAIPVGQQPTGIAVDTANVYWSNGGDSGKIMKRSVAGGDPVVLADAEVSPQYLVIDATNVYWVNYVASGAIKKVPIAGGKVVTVAEGAVSTPRDVTLSGGFLYLINQTPELNVNVVRVSVVDGATSVLLTAARSKSFTAIRVNATSVFLSGGDGVYTMPLAGGTLSTLYTSLHTGSFELDETNVYIDSAMGLVTLPIGGGTSRMLVGPELGSYIDSLVVDAASVYWSRGGTILATSKVP